MAKGIIVSINKIFSTLTLDKLQEKVISLGEDETWMSEEEVNQILKDLKEKKI